ncbi:MAG: insulinase family protein [Clostridia bacterium]|nr:insulinase family protein [Clostridia bacterium]
MIFDLQKISNEKIGEYYYKFRHESGLTVLFAPNSYTASFAVIAAKYGSIDTTFDTCRKRYITPEGTAHFLEHKLFETEDGGDAFDLFAKTGAWSNAYTGFTSTAYLFSASYEFYKSLEILLDFVYHPHFTEASVEKERGIIAEELASYEDSPGNRCYFELLRCLYKDHPVRNDIGGTAETIKRVTPELLYLVHGAFYTPDNMVLSISGDLDLDKIVSTLDKCLPPPKKLSERVYAKYPREIPGAYKKQSVLKMQTSAPLFAFGAKDPHVPDDPQKRYKRGLALSVIADMYFGQSSEFYTGLYEEGLLNGDVSAEYSYSESYGHFVLSGESKKPFTVRSRIKKQIEKIRKEKINEADFGLCKKIFYSGFIGSLQNSQSYAYEMLYACLDGHGLLSYPEDIKELSAEYAYGVFCEVFNDGQYSFSLVNPID